MIRAEYFGKLGGTQRFYWLVAQFVSAAPLTQGPAIVQTTNPLTLDNRVLLNWDYVPGSTYYSVVQTPTATPPDLQRDVVAVIISTTTLHSATDYGVVQDWYYPNPGGSSGVFGVSSFNGRTGNVLPSPGDYTAAMVTGAVPNTRAVWAGLGLNGGGPLYADVTLNVTPDTTLQKTYIYKSGIPTGQRSYLNFIGGSNVTISADDNPGQNWIDIVVAAPGALTNFIDPTIVKGDLMVNDGVEVVRLPVGSNGQTLIADSDAPKGIKWAEAALNQTPWLSDIDANSHTLYELGNISNSSPAMGNVGSDFSLTMWRAVVTPAADRIFHRTQILPEGYIAFSHNLGWSYPNFFRDDPSIESGIVEYRRAFGAPSGSGFIAITDIVPSDNITTAFPSPSIEINSPMCGISLNTKGGTRNPQIYMGNSSIYHTASTRLTYWGSALAAGQSPRISLNPDVSVSFDLVTDAPFSVAQKFYFDLLNTRLGVGDITPSYAVDVLGDVNVTGAFRINGTPLAVGSVSIQDEGTVIGTQPTINFVGAGVTSTLDAPGARITVTIPGGGGGGSLAIQDEGTAVGTQPNLNFVGSGVSATLDTLNNRVNVVISGTSGTGGIPIIVNGVVIGNSGRERYSDEFANAAVDAMAAKLNGGSIKIYDGTQPLNPGVAITTQVLLAVPTFGSPAFNPASGGVGIAKPITSGTGLAAGTATWFRACKSDGTPMFDGSAGGEGSDLFLASPTISVGAPVPVTSFQITEEKVGA